jgi:hypothetical protein
MKSVGSEEFRRQCRGSRGGGGKARGEAHVPAAEEVGLGAVVGGSRRSSGGRGGRARGEAHVPKVEEAGLGAWVRWRLHKIRPGASGGNPRDGGLNTDQVSAGEVGPVGAVCLDRFTHG